MHFRHKTDRGPAFWCSQTSQLVAAALVVAAVLFGTVPGDSRFSQTLQNAAHGPAFFVLAFICSRWIRGRHAWAVVLALSAAVGISIEGIQALIGRDASYADIATDLLGAVAGLSASTSRAPGSCARLLRFTSVVAIALAVAPLGWCTAAYLNRAARLPVLAEFRSPLDSYFFEAQSADLRVEQSYLSVRLRPGRWPGVALAEPAPDWSGYALLSLDLENPEGMPLVLTVRVHDGAHNHQSSDRYNGSFKIAPMTRARLRIPIRDLENAPHRRRMDMTQVAGLVLFSSPAAAGQLLRVHRIALE